METSFEVKSTHDCKKHNLDCDFTANVKTFSSYSILLCCKFSRYRKLLRQPRQLWRAVRHE